MRNQTRDDRRGAAAGLRQSGPGPDAADQAGAAGRCRQTGSFDVGVPRSAATDGDEARYERYRDLRTARATLFEMDKNTDSYRFNASASQRRLPRPAVRGRVQQRQARR